MQLHQLTFRAIGPFAGEHMIDFDHLGASGLFLLEGPTGAGKSTIIDAIVFALYGGLAGEESSKQRLHSHHAEPGVEPYVDLTFSTQSGDYRIRRSPAHQRPKNRGTGTTTQNESAKFSRLASLETPERGEEISTRTQEIGNEIKEIIGLDRQQFLQTVVLPQGEFAKFLRSTGEDRKDLLRTIFRTDVYESLTEQLKTMRNQAGRSIEGAQSRVAEAFAGFQAASEHEFDDALDESDFDNLASACVSAAAELAEAAGTARFDNEKAQAQLATTHNGHQQQSLLAKRLRTRSELLTEKAALAELADGVDALRAEIDAAQRAATIVRSIDGLQVALKRRATAATAHDRAREALGSTDEVTRAELVARRDDLVDEISELGHLLDVEAGMPERRLGLDAIRHKRADLHTRIERLSAAVAAAPATIEHHEEQRSWLQIAAQTLPDLTTRVEKAATALEAARIVTKTTHLLATTTARLDELAGEATATNSQVRQLRQRQLDEYAGVLSQQLQDGEPCAVCGSAEHPVPAQLQHDHPSVDDIEAAERRLSALTSAVATTADETNDHKQELARRHEQAGGLDEAEAELQLDQARRQEKTARDAVQQLTTADTTLKTLRSRLASDEAQLTQAKVELAVIDTDLAKLEEAIEADALRIAKVVEGRAHNLARLVAALRDRRSTMDRTIAAGDAHRAAVEAAELRQIEVDDALVASGFPSIEEAQDARLDAAELSALEAQVGHHQRRSAVVTDRLADPDLAELTGEETTDVEAATQALEQAQLTARETQKLADVLSAREKSAARALAILTSALEVHAAAVAESGAIVRLAGVAEGSHPANIKKVSLGTYVLMRRFDDVVAAANVRYAPMSNGRYQLVRIEEKEGKGGGRRTGLALAIQDGETGRQREPRTLSGGETFNASLSLALGLADVVTAEAGGIELGTLFVDEGFGTLDAESLDRVMIELGRLSRGGRMVGIVSHVDELKQRVAERVEVRRMKSGSSTLTVKAGGQVAEESAV